ncbi:hypothetical protein IDH44_09660 [Paenibacillus sp. IB182496]|uniref:Uncharacterized protein n=1 Tax=Paenibacillus sabuli TaxID=2772509 RepID=A0A927BTM2_9BACL|nr:hypothetical protein [Paenibacillus sabuli]MBD2845455.1 hypothetical protein [Paenibacillus sabuli]
MGMSQKSKKKISRELRLAALTENNRASFIEFEEWITSPQKNYTPGAIDQISSVILKFLYGCMAAAKPMQMN